MKKVKVKMNYDEFLAFFSLLSDFHSSRANACRHDLERLLVASVLMLRIKYVQKTLIRFPKPKTFSFNVAEGFAISNALTAVTSANEHTEATRVTLLMDIQKQSPK